MSKEGMTVCLEDFLKYLLKKWKVIVPIIVLCATLFLVAALEVGEEITVPPSEEYLYLMEQKEALELYKENSLIMKMDVQNVYERKIFIKNISDKKELEEYISSGEVWNELNTEVSREYLQEILRWVERVNVETAEVKVFHYEEKTCEEYARYLKNELTEFDSNCVVSIGPGEVVVDYDILTGQLWTLDQMHKLDSQLEIAAAGFTLRISKLAAVCTGMFFGALLSVVILFFKYLLKDQWK